MAHPRVREAINRAVSGDPHVWPIAALRNLLGSRAPLRNPLSVGCGVGSLERSLIDEGVATQVTAIDVSESVIAEARSLAGGRPITYHCVDARQFLRDHPRRFNAVFFHQSLHHFTHLDELMMLVRQALLPGGFLYVDEYVGPSRDEWSALRLLAPNLAYRLLPRGTRRPWLVRAPINREDPTEAVESSAIIGAIERTFRVTHRRDYGGNLLAVVYPNLRLDAPRFDRAVDRLLRFERWLSRLGTRPFYTVMVAGP